MATINSASILWWLVEHTLTTALLTGIVLVLCRWCRFRPALRHGLWLLVLGLQIVLVSRFWRVCRRAEPAPQWLGKQVRKLVAKLRVRLPRTMVVAGIGSPLVWSLGRPKLLWPATLTEGLAPGCLRGVI